MFLDVSIDERSDVASSGARLVCGLGNRKGVQQLIEHFDRFLILGLGVGGVIGHGIHDFDSGHDVRWLRFGNTREVMNQGVGQNAEGGEGVKVGKSWVSLKQEARADAPSALYLAWSIATEKRLMGIRNL